MAGKIPREAWLVLISVAGATSRAGKTAFAATLLKALPRGRATAVKFTTTEDVFERCPRGSACVVCDIDVPYRIVEDEATLAQPGTDTERLGRAGARRVVWAIAKASAAPQAWEAVRRRIEGVVIMEGSTVVGLSQPELTLFVVHPFLSPARWKPTSGPLLARADLVVVNRAAEEARPPAAEVMAAIESQREGKETRVADVRRPLAEWAPGLAACLAGLAGGSAPGPQP
jgi:hypothetical protein